MAGALFLMQITGGILLFLASLGIFSIIRTHKIPTLYILETSITFLGVWSLFTALGNFTQNILFIEVGYFFSGLGLIFSSIFAEYYLRERTRDLNRCSFMLYYLQYSFRSSITSYNFCTIDWSGLYTI